MATQIDILNSALTLLGSPTVPAVTANARSAIAIMAIYNQVKLAELRKKPGWNFSIKLATLNANATPPAFGRASSFPLPNDFIAIAPQLPEMNYAYLDWLIQDKQIYSAQTGTLQLRYVSNVTEDYFDPLFSEALAAALAKKACNTVTQSKGMLQILNATYDEAIQEARKANAFDNVPMRLPIDPFITVRL
jgi:hypothetical protein